MAVRKKQERKLLGLRYAIDKVQPEYRQTIALMARLLGPDKLAGINDSIVVRPRPTFDQTLQRLRLTNKLQQVLDLSRKGMTDEQISEHFGQGLQYIREVREKAFAELEEKLPFVQPIRSDVFEKHRTLFERMGYSTYPPQIEYYQPESPMVLDIFKAPLAILNLNIRSVNCIRNANFFRNMKIETVGDLIQKSEGELLKLQGFNKKSLHDVKSALAEYGLRLSK